jgi:hypothetical protein
MYNYNNNSLEIDISGSLTYTFKELSDLTIDINTLKRVWFPKELRIDKNGKRYLE